MSCTLNETKSYKWCIEKNTPSSHTKEDLDQQK